jgi:Tol biopolymer transport system component
MLSPGDRLGPYEVVSLLGAGGMGEVYRARDAKLERDVALKVLPQGALADENARRRFRKEALALSRLAHPHIAAVHDFDTADDGADFLVMELVPGASLDTKLKHGPLPEKEVVRLGAQILRALVAAHEHGVVHRDLKPANLKLTSDGLVKVLDFGLARIAAVLGDDATTDTASGVAAGTPPYMSPEQLLGREVDERTDIYAAGVVLYEMAAGRRPFGEASGPQLVAKILHEPMPPPREVNAEISPALEQVILKASDKDRELRHQTAKELLVDLERLAAGTATASAAARPKGAASLPRSAARRRLLAVAAGMTALAALGAAALRLLQPREPRITATRTLVRSRVSGLETDGTSVFYSVAGRLMVVPLAGGEPREIPLPWGGTGGPKLVGRRPDPPALLLWRASTDGGEAWQLPLYGGAPTRIEGLRNIHDASWSPHGDRLAWVALGEKGSEILWAGDGAGGNPRRLAEVASDSRGGRHIWLTGWHPSGAKVRYVPSGAKGFLDVGADGGAPEEVLIDDDADWGTGAWSADGRLFLHGSTRGVLAFPEGQAVLSGRETPALGGPTHTWLLRATPDGRRLVGAVHRPGTEIVRVDPSTRDVAPLLGRAAAGVLAFSSDGSRVAWAGPDRRLFVSRPDGTGSHALGDRPADDDAPFGWSPNGRWVAFSAEVGGPDVVNSLTRLHLASPSEGTVEPLTAEDAGRRQVDPCWSPDGRSLAYGPSPVNGLPADEEIYLRRVDLDTRRVTKIEGSEGLWSPKCATDGTILATDEFAARAAGSPGPGSPASRQHFKVLEAESGRWRPLVVDLTSGGAGAGHLFYGNWARDGRWIYAYRWPERHVVRFDSRTGRLEKVVDVSGLGETSVWLGLDPTDAPLVHRDASVREIVVMDLEWN